MQVRGTNLPCQNSCIFVSLYNKYLYIFLICICQMRALLILSVKLMFDLTLEEKRDFPGIRLSARCSFEKNIARVRLHRVRCYYFWDCENVTRVNRWVLSPLLHLQCVCWNWLPIKAGYRDTESSSENGYYLSTCLICTSQPELLQAAKKETVSLIFFLFSFSLSKKKKKAAVFKVF